MPSIPFAISLGAARTGLTITANVRAVGSASVTSVPMSEIVTGSYEGTFTSPATAASYVVEVVDGDGKQYGTGSFSTDAAGNEITPATVLAAVENQPSPGGFVQTITVTNASGGAAIEGAIVRYAQAGVTKDEATAGADGVALIAVSAGTYTRTVVAADFDSDVATGVAVAADAAASVALNLRTDNPGSPVNVAPGLAN